jgi:hypothetical protein
MSDGQCGLSSRGECSARVRYSFHRGRILNNPNYQAIKGLDSFRGPVLHKAAWTADTDLGNKKVAIIGAGAGSI